MRIKYRFLKREMNSIIKEAVSLARIGGHEICGLMVSNGYFLELVKVRNKCKKGGSFAFYENEVKSLEKFFNLIGHEIVGTFHSHPFYLAKPGETDIESANDDSIMLIIDVQAKKPGLWHIKNKKIKQLPLVLIT